MPQSERSQNIKAILKWLRDVVGSKGATVQQIIAYVIFDVTEFGATEKTAKSYVEALRRAGFIEPIPDSPRLRITNAGKRWLEEHG